MFQAASIVLDDKTRAVLEGRVRAAKTPQREAVRARIVLLAADGVPSRQIARQVEMHESNVAQWRKRFRAEGLAGLTTHRGRVARRSMTRSLGSRWSPRPRCNAIPTSPKRPGPTLR